MNVPNYYTPAYPAYNPTPYMQQSYADRMAQLNQMQYANTNPVLQPQQTSTAPQQAVKQISGRYVTSAEEVTASEVPMDGSVSIFPKIDLSEMYAKAWKPDGTIQTVVYKPVIPAQSEQVSAPASQHFELSDETKNMILDKFNAIFERLDNLDRNIASTTKPARRSGNNES